MSFAFAPFLKEEFKSEPKEICSHFANNMIYLENNARRSIKYL